MHRATSSALALMALCLFGSAGRSAESGDLAKAPPQLRAAVTRLTEALSAWSLHSVDRQPSVAVDGQRGYRVVLRQTRRELRPGAPAPQQAEVAAPRDDDPRYLTRHVDWDFVLVPVGGGNIAPEAKREMRWHVPDEREFRLPVALGEGHGFVWFSYSNVPMQHYLRKQLMLTGGDNRLQLALRGLSVKDEGMMTRNSAARMFVEFGDEGFAALDRLIGGEDTANAIRAMAHFHDARATARLVELYGWPNGQVQQAAALALVHMPPYRPGAKQAYFEMIRRQQRVIPAMRACLEFGWQDALPLIKEVVERPSSLAIYRDAYPAYRQLSGDQIEAELLAAKKTIERQGALDRESRATAEQLALARRTIVESADAEGAAFLAFCLATLTSKSNTAPVNKDGIEMLRALPRPLVQKTVRRNWEVLEESDRTQLLDLFRQVP